jgi:hypothetical protein
MESFLIGGVSGISATLIMYPFEYVKSNSQMYGEMTKMKYSSIRLGCDIVRNNGFGYLYRGIGYATTRQMVYTSLRIGLYDHGIRQIKTTQYDTIPVKLGVGLFAGITSSLISAPFDRMIVGRQVGADQQLPTNGRQFFNLWKGSSTTVARASVINSTSLTINNVLNVDSIDWTDRLYASTMSGLFTGTISLPFDIVRTRVLSDKNNKYNGSLDCIKKIYRYEGMMAFMKGYPFYVTRIGTQSSLILFLSETMLSHWRRSDPRIRADRKN